MLNCIDNSGATLVECVANLRMKRHGRVGTVTLRRLYLDPKLNIDKVTV